MVWVWKRPDKPHCPLSMETMQIELQQPPRLMQPLMEEQVLADVVQHVPGLCVPALGADFSWPLQLCLELSCFSRHT